jgi:hypothetical protein
VTLLLRSRLPLLALALAVVAVQDCLVHLSRHRWKTTERSPDEAQAVVIQVIAITSGRK